MKLFPQDCLESCFGVIRLIGWAWTNPHPAEFYNRLRLVLITAGEGYVLAKSPVSGAEPDDAVMLSAEPGALATLAAQGAQVAQPLADAGGDQETSASPASESAEEQDSSSEAYPSTDENATDDELSPYGAAGNVTVADEFEPEQLQEAETDRHLDTLEELFGEDQNNLSANEESDSEDEIEHVPGELQLPSITPEECAEQGLIFCAGWLASEVKETHPEFADPTGQLPVSELPIWLARLSRGGLSAPRRFFLAIYKQMESEFNNFVGGPLKISYQRRVTETFLKLLQRNHPDMPKVLLSKFTNFRFHLRKRYLNTLRREAEGERREMLRARRKAAQYVS